MGDRQRTWPDDLEMGQQLEFHGQRYEVVGTGPAEATLEPIGTSGFQLEVHRWAFTDAVEFELNSTVSQEDFSNHLVTDTDP